MMEQNKFLFFLGTLSIFFMATAAEEKKERTVVIRTSPHTIVLFMGPQIARPLLEGEKPKPNATDIEKIARVRLQQAFNPPISGVYVANYGAVTTLNENGQAYLPRKNPEDEITLIITKGLRPIIINGQTVEQFKRKKTSDADYYLFTRLSEPEGECLWNVTKLPIPENRIIPPQAIVIYAKPKDIFVPEGVFTTTCGPHLVLPPIYPTRKISRDLNALSFLKINRYFAPVRKVYKYSKDRYTTMLW